VNITNAGYGALGSYSIIFGSLGNGTPYDFIKEVQVKTGGYEAEYGQAIGGVVNVVTKSGTNLMRGSAFGYARPQGLEGNWKQYESKNGTVPDVGIRPERSGRHHRRADHEGQAVLLRRDRSELGHARLSRRRTTKDADGNYQFPLYTQGGIDRKRQITSYSAKATYNLSSNQHSRRVVLRRPGARRTTGRSGRRHCSARTPRSTAS
jgi:outer membrane receptor protein involved in Fe transport